MPSEPGNSEKKKKSTVAAAGKTPPADTKQNTKQSRAKTRKPAEPAGSSAVPPKPRKNRRGPRTSGLAGAVGQGLYLLGFYAECKFVQIWRVLRVGLGLLGQLLLWAFGGALRATGRFLKGFFSDLGAPFHRAFVGMRNVRKVLSEEKEKGSENAQKTALKYFGSGVRTYLYLIGNLIKFFLPIGAAAIFGFTVYSVLNLEYNLEITVNGVSVGVIAEEATFEEARNIVRQRIVAAEGKGAESWQVVPEYRLIGISDLTTQDQLVNNMLQTYDAGDDDALVDATGIVVDDTLLVTYDGTTVESFLQGMLDQYDTGEVDVSFVQEVSYDLEAEDLFFASSVRGADEVIEELTRVVEEKQVYTATGQESLSDIAHNNGIALSTLLDFNPGLTYEEWTPEVLDEDGAPVIEPPDEEEDEEGEEGGRQLDGEYVPAPGTELVVQPEQRFLQVQTKRIVYDQEVIPFETRVQENPDWQKGRSVIVQNGSNGLQEVAYEITTIDGIETKLPAEGIEPNIINHPVEQIIEEGIFEYDYKTGTANIQGSAAYIWPVPEYTRQGRGMSSGHRGADINASEWANILAIQGGTVVEAGWHYSWGNTILIDHGNGVTSRYAHCIQLNVAVGDMVEQGTVIGFVGTTGNSSGNHLHLEITVGGGLVDPYSYVSPP